METENIERFLRPPSHGGSYTDEKLAALLAHTEEGKLRFYSCCCLAGIPTADHSLQGLYSFDFEINTPTHLIEARKLPFACESEEEFLKLGMSDEERRELLLPLIHAEIARRDTENWKAAQEESELADKLGILPIGW